MRDAVGADDLQAARLAPEQVEGGAQGPYEQVVLVAGERSRALARDVDVQAGIGHAHHHVVVEPERQAEGVESRPEVGAGGGDAHPYGGGAESGTGHRLDDSPCVAAKSRRDTETPDGHEGNNTAAYAAGRVGYSLSKEGSVAT